nr:hypothetical protein GCM10025732_26730 [Glycomyces mayteni]
MELDVRAALVKDHPLKGRAAFVTGASRGIGAAIAVALGAAGAKVALFAKTGEPHPKLPGTLYETAKAVEEAGGQALPIVGDLRDAESVAEAVDRAAAEFGGSTPASTTPPRSTSRASASSPSRSSTSSRASTSAAPSRPSAPPSRTCANPTTRTC